MSYELTYQLSVPPRTVGAVVITATPDNVFAQNLVQINNLGVYDGMNLVRVINSVESPVRGGTNLVVTGLSEVDIFDYECPLDVPVFYKAYFDGILSFNSNTVQIDTDGRTFWLKDVILGSFSTKVNVEAMSDVVRPANVLGTFKVLGRKNPIIVTDVRQGRTGTMTLSAFTTGDSTALSNILASGNTLLFQAPGSANFPDMYFQAGDVTETWRGIASDPTHTWAIPFTETDAPSEGALSLGSNSWLIVTQFSTWQSVLDGRVDWEGVFTTPFGVNDV